MSATALRGRLVLPDRVVPDGVVELRDGLLGYVGEAAGWSGAEPTPYAAITPGLVDIHCHGGGGHSVTTGDPADVAAAAAHHLRRGTTTMLASLVSASPDDIERGVRAVAEVAGSGGSVVGSHLEGPFLGPGHCGAHDPAMLRHPDPALVERWLAAGAGSVRMVTMAPELPGADPVAGRLAAAGVLVALGHTDADAATFGAALAGADVVTHLFNGMAPLHHRDPGPVAAALTGLAAGDVRVELIADGTHLADPTVRMVFALAPADGVLLVSDAMAAAGMPDGEYRLGPLAVTVRDAVAWTTGESPSIAGSTAHLADLVHRCVVSAGIDPVPVLRAATATPASVLGLADRGRLGTGLRADVVAFDEDWRVARTWRGGEVVA